MQNFEKFCITLCSSHKEQKRVLHQVWPKMALIKKYKDV